MNAQAAIEHPAVPAYPLLKTALALYGRAPADLAQPERREAERQVRRQAAVEARILKSPEAAAVVISQQAVREAAASIAGRYANRDEFLADLARNGLDEPALIEALAREFRVEAVVERVAAGVAPPSMQDVEIFYYQHQARFLLPERRTARHILITLNPDYAENSPAAVQSRIESLRAAIAEGADFAALARRHSECPSALEGGLLGSVAAGDLFPELGSVLFALREGEVSAAVASELGYHLLLCERVEPGRRVPLAEVAEKIRDSLTARARERHLRQWLAGRG